MYNLWVREGKQDKTNIPLIEKEARSERKMEHKSDGQIGNKTTDNKPKIQKITLHRMGWIIKWKTSNVRLHAKNKTLL